MAQSIFKYVLPTGPYETEIPMPSGAKILSAHNQRNQPCIWALVETLNPVSNRAIRAEHTGECRFLPPEAVFIGTVLLDDGDYVLHVFDLGEV